MTANPTTSVQSPTKRLRSVAFAEATPEQVIEILFEDGGVIIEGILSPAEVDTTRAEFGRLLADAPFCTTAFLGHRTKRVYSAPIKTRCFDEYYAHPFLLEILDQVLGEYQLSSITPSEIWPGEIAQTLHRDDSSWPIESTEEQPLNVGVLWALDDFTETNGATRVIPNSHRDPDAWEEAIAVMPRGSLLLYLGSTLHGGGPNESDGPRLGLVTIYSLGWLRTQENIALYLKPEDMKGRSPRVQELLGYNLYETMLGHVETRHPRESLLGEEHIPLKPSRNKKRRVKRSV